MFFNCLFLRLQLVNFVTIEGSQQKGHCCMGPQLTHISLMDSWSPVFTLYRNMVHQWMSENKIKRPCAITVNNIPLNDLYKATIIRIFILAQFKTYSANYVFKLFLNLGLWLSPNIQLQVLPNIRLQRKSTINIPLIFWLAFIHNVQHRWESP